MSDSARTLFSRREWLCGLGASVALLSLGGCSGGAFTPTSKRFAYITDLHSIDQWGCPDALDILGNRLNKAHPEFILIGGDLVHGGFRSTPEAMEPRWNVVMKFLHSLEAKWYSAAGNHDLIGAQKPDFSPGVADPRAIFREKLKLQQAYQSYNIGGQHVIILDSVQPVAGNKWGYRGEIPEAQMQWIREDLKQTDASTPIILVTHMPILSNYFLTVMDNTQPPAPSLFLTNGMAVLDLFSRHNLRLVLQGHLHIDETLTWHGVTFITGGSVCGKWWGGPNCGTPEGYGFTEMAPGKINWDYQTLGWKAQRIEKS